MARRPFDPAGLGWQKTEYRRGDILDREAVEELVAGVDAVVHLAFIVVQASAASEDINVEGSRNVFEATVAAGVLRLVYTSSVAAYGYGQHGERMLSEDVEARGTERHAYSHQKAEVERVLAEATAGAATRVYVFRPCVVAGPQATALLDQLPYVRLERNVPPPLRRALGRLPGVKPVLPDHGVPFQLVHHRPSRSGVRLTRTGSPVCPTTGAVRPGPQAAEAGRLTPALSTSPQHEEHSVRVLLRGRCVLCRRSRRAGVRGCRSREGAEVLAATDGGRATRVRTRASALVGPLDRTEGAVMPEPYGWRRLPRRRITMATRTLTVSTTLGEVG
jgi:hypothetical protein